MTKAVTLILAGALTLAGCVGIASAQEDPAPAVQALAGAPEDAPTSRSGMPQPVTLAQRPDATGGEALYVVNCIMCHGAVGMGTGLLARKGRPEAELEKRSDLAAAFVILAARNGIGNMPAIPRGEVSDADLQAIADYLAAGPHHMQAGAGQ